MSTTKKTTTKKTETATQTPPAPTTFTPKVKKQVTLELLKKSDGVPVYVRINAPIFTGKEVRGSGAKAKMEPARLANCTNLETGKACQIIVNKVLESILCENYPDDGYVGRGFEIIQYQPEGKRYKNYEVSELELD